MPVPATVLENKIEGAAGGFYLLVMGPDVFATYPLPPAGAVTIGRGETAEVQLSDPMASRQHARLHTGELFQIEDLGSANKTRVREVPLAPGERTSISPGEAIGIGSTILMVQQRLPQRVRLVKTHNYLEARLEEECARSEMTRDPFALIRLHLEAPLPESRLTELCAPVLRLPDVLVRYGPSEYEILLLSATPDMAARMTQDLTRALREAGVTIRTGVATYPRDGRTPEALIGVASQRVRGVEEDRGALGELSYDPIMQRVHALADRAAQGTINVLIVGENGVGKEILAARIHERSARASKPFLAINCASFAEQLFESELFGHERGAFTGAADAKPGLLETAPGGTVLLDEIGELPLPLQTRLLRVLETRLVTRVGGIKARPIDVRFVAATNRNLESEVAAGRFRRDLYFRLNGMTLHIPPLRARRGEIGQLALLFLERFAEQLRRPVPEIGAEARRLLEAHPWPGNVRELRNMMERAILLCSGDDVLPEHLLLDSGTDAFGGAPGADWSPAPMVVSEAREIVAGRDTQPMSVPADGEDFDAERERILRVLARNGGNQSRTAKELGMARSTLVLKLNSYEIPRPRKKGG